MILQANGLVVVLALLGILTPSYAQPICYTIAANSSDVTSGGITFVGDATFEESTIEAPILTTVATFLPYKVGDYMLTTLQAESTCSTPGFDLGEAPNCRYEFSMSFCSPASDSPFNSCESGTEKSGTFGAAGPGPANRPITGGTGDFASATGELVTNGSFQIALNPNGGITIAFDAAITICIGFEEPTPTPTSPPNDLGYSLEVEGGTCSPVTAFGGYGGNDFCYQYATQNCPDATHFTVAQSTGLCYCCSAEYSVVAVGSVFNTYTIDM